MMKIAEDAFAVGNELVDLDDMIQFLECHEWNGKTLRVDIIDLPEMAEAYNE